ncbi:prepilin-type N-terminal cleavage/methylation domain-containing protein [Geomonas sp. Red69]|uniref:Prepilin-type N-terminal cleavage/methylation domain-containing protein n=1 Tax=Geomonas diazotrophica TaxID=2843197 RepID=A0ABX8JHB3_9BACT|nr:MULTISPECIES: prepilin-type N-terminal cleavage/methylation domain-containing protein [Geomonas]MBU5636141.1 prepilin-type N-terminal cleavage/methylation domain-containing protein [Geomonas diazotrophica]QWV96039.1 prepilin-type N-terminal cleavage/methylation domain-containing protein [Geomonas nitrogeniifigens]QXE85107.1 prepilin-type N-terminal cleavage/methylation domain-containing protein [Geomonas nitrogeniifigens]
MRAAGRDGYTFVEVLVALVVFSVTMTLISASFARIVTGSKAIGKSTETDIGGMIGLELLRTDLELAGFGLPYSGTKGLNYVEAEEGLQLVTSCPGGCPDARPGNYNDAPHLDAPTPYRIGDNVGYNGSDYLVLKGTALGASAVCRSWCYLTYSSVTRPSRVEPELKNGGKDRVIVLKNEVVSGRPTRVLVTSGTNFTVPFQLPFPSEFSPRERTDHYLVYGVAPKDSAGGLLSFPFNRSDYFINRKVDKMSAFCSPGTGTLYKAVINHQGSPTKYPILDCAGDLQAVLYFDTNADGKVDYHPKPGDALLNAQTLREELREIRVYILAQQGKKDPSYSFPVEDPARVIVVGDPELPDDAGQVWSERALKQTFGPEWRNYRWKVYAISVLPKNL